MCIVMTLSLAALLVSAAPNTDEATNTVVPETIDTVVPEDHPLEPAEDIHDPVRIEEPEYDVIDETSESEASGDAAANFQHAKVSAKILAKKLKKFNDAYVALMKQGKIPTSADELVSYNAWLVKLKAATLKVAKLTVRLSGVKSKGIDIWKTYAQLEATATHLKTRLEADQAAKEEVKIASDLAQQENDKFFKSNTEAKEDLHFFDTKEEMVQLRDELNALVRKHKIPIQKLSVEDHNHAISKFVYHISMGHHETLNDEELAQTIAGNMAGKMKMSYGQTATTKCVQAALASVAPKYCWKGGSYNHDTNMRCPTGWTHPPGMAECFRPCRAGYRWAWGGTCWKSCPAHHVETGPTCNRAWWGSCCTHIWAPWGRRRARVCASCLQVSVIGRHSYWPDRFTFLDSRMECRQRYQSTYSNGDTDLQYQAGALCYRRCDSFLPGPALTGCGFDACAATSGDCLATIGNMIFEISMTIAGIVAIIATAGAAGPAVVGTRVAMKTVASKMGKQAAKRLAQNTAKSLRRGGTATFQKVAWRTAVKRGLGKELKDMAKGTPQTVLENWSQNAIKSYCQAQATRLYNAADPNSQRTMDPAAWDPTGIANMAEKCKAGPEDMDCKAAIVGAAGNFDPTGLMGVAAAFMHKDCESCDLACRVAAERDLDRGYTKRSGLFCDSYGYDGNTYRFNNLGAARAACDADVNCGGIKQWTCGAAQYGLCGKAGWGLRNYGAARCTYVK